MNEELHVNFYHYSDDSSTVFRAISREDGEDNEREMRQHLYLTQPRLLVFVGADIARKFYHTQAVRYGVIERMTYENSPRETVVFVLPSTSPEHEREQS